MAAISFNESHLANHILPIIIILHLLGFDLSLDNKPLIEILITPPQTHTQSESVIGCLSIMQRSCNGLLEFIGATN